MGVNSLPKTVTRQRRDCDLNPGPSAPESSTLTTRLPSHQISTVLVDENKRRKHEKKIVHENFDYAVFSVTRYMQLKKIGKANVTLG